MYSEKAQSNIDSLLKRHKKQLNSMYLRVEAYEKLLFLEEKYGLTIYFFDSFPSTLSINYSLSAEESLMYKSNLIFEEVDEILNLSIFRATEFVKYKKVRLSGFYKGKVEIDLCVDFSGSKKCNLEYEDVVTKKAILKCY